MRREVHVDAVRDRAVARLELRASLDRFFLAGFGDTRHPQRLNLFTTENLIAWLERDGFAIKPAMRGQGSKILRPG